MRLHAILLNYTCNLRLTAQNKHYRNNALDQTLTGSEIKVDLYFVGFYTSWNSDCLVHGTQTV